MEIYLVFIMIKYDLRCEFPFVFNFRVFVYVWLMLDCSF